ncbi:hypothetical protein PENSPDRAFT_672371 [Peniophora sp. CONT]|nr:hypothetical protein PENSPDRAFT_672371 [Peniophora sp. CONT]
MAEMSLGWRANIDIKPILSKNAAINYTSKYASKAKSDTLSFPELSKTGTIILGSEGLYRELEIQNEGMGADLGEDAAAQNDGRRVTCESWIQRYTGQSDAMENLSIRQVHQSYRWTKGKWTKWRDTNVVVRAFPRYAPDPEDPKYDELCRTKVLLHHPFHSTNALRGVETENKSDPEEDKDKEMVNPDVAEMTEADRELFARLHPNAALPVFGHADLGNRLVDEAWNTDHAREHYGDCNKMVSYISEQRCITNDHSDGERPPVDPETLDAEQRAIYARYISTYEQILAGEQNIDQILINVDSAAGCGKTYLIDVICHRLKGMAAEHGLPVPYRVFVLSGVATHNICGVTIHSALGIPANKDSFKKLGAGTRLAQLQTSWKGVYFVFVDKKSMLPPVMDLPLYVAPGLWISLLRHAGHIVYRDFRKSYLLKTVVRQQGQSEAQIKFMLLLKHTLERGLTKEDWKLLVTREISNLTPEERTTFTDAVHHTRSSGDDQYGESRSLELANRAAGMSAGDAGGLKPDVLLARGARVMVTQNLWQQNRIGLVNRTLGVVEDVIWEAGAYCNNLPLVVMVAVPDYTGPTLWQTAPCNGFPDGVPVVPIMVNRYTYPGPLPCTRAREFTNGLTFVAILRVRNLQSLCLAEPVNFSRVEKLAGANYEA